MGAERDELANQVTALTTERDRLAGITQQQAAETEGLRTEISQVQQAAEAARIECATAHVKAEQAAERLKDRDREIERLRSELAEARQAPIAHLEQAAEKAQAHANGKHGKRRRRDFAETGDLPL